MRKLLNPFIPVLLALASPISLAEGVLLKSDPKNNAEVTGFDGTVKFWFSGNVGERSPSVVVVDAQGKRVDNGDARLVLGERHRLTATTQTLPPGDYATRYRVITEDGLIVSGVSKFSIVAESAPGEAKP
ncbi:copper resistance protein CopC [Methylomonas sp. LW13]|uniref:copper resistance CopC family protein n=1 Tax=unclassified Methylomonas TaxID=2608980 RepID=UPI00051AE216|nr:MULTISPECIES: copper resistance CopC family protein [unclassified Methylomonas]PKD38592.1 copper resistance protein CopC [Methylomonas sp. Kb3]QBC28621.1 copper resistance protein CopC [Methylomonas sp. LW13]